jgi:hypothetical protein
MFITRSSVCIQAAFAFISLSLLSACGSDSTTPATADASALSDASGSADATAAADGAGSATPDAGSTADATIPTNSSPCAYAVSGGQTFPTGAATYICTNNSRVYQSKGQGPFTLLFGAGFAMGADSSTLACSLTSATPPKAGDTWTLGMAGSDGLCDLSFQQGAVTNLWKASAAAPTAGTATVTFVSATLMHGTAHPEDVYYLFELTFTATLKGQTPNAPDVTVTGSYKASTLPLGS